MVQINQIQKRKFLILVGLFNKTYYNAKISEIESKIPRIKGLATNSAQTAVEIKLPGISSLVKKQIIM